MGGDDDISRNAGSSTDLVVGCYETALFDDIMKTSTRKRQPVDDVR